MLNFVSSILCCCFNCRLAGFEIHIRSWAARVSCYAECCPKGRRQALNSFKKPSTNQRWKYLMRSLLFHRIKQNTCLALISIDFHLWTRLATLFVCFFCCFSFLYPHSISVRTIGLVFFWTNISWVTANSWTWSISWL